MKNIQLFKPVFRIDECLAEIRQCLEKGWTGLGYKTVEIEEEWKGYSGLPHAHFLNSATAGLHLALRVLKEENKWLEGDEVITTPLTFVSTNHAIEYEHLQPVFADVDSSLNLNPASVERCITPKTKAIIFVGIGGNATNLNQVQKIAQKNGLKLILDAAHMAGTRVKARHVGQEADVTIFSFQAVKNLGTSDAGMICFADGELDHFCRQLTWLGINKDTYTRQSSKGNYKWKYDVDHVGYKYHGNSIAASLALVGLRYLDRDNSYRRCLATWYEKELQGVEGVEVVSHGECESSRHLFQVMVENREVIISHLNQNGVFPGVHYRDNTEYKPFQFAEGTCPNARQYSERLLSLPMHLDVSHDDVKWICKQLRLAVGKGNE